MQYHQVNFYSLIGSGGGGGGGVYFFSLDKYAGRYNSCWGDVENMGGVGGGVLGYFGFSLVNDFHNLSSNYLQC